MSQSHLTLDALCPSCVLAVRDHVCPESHIAIRHKIANCEHEPDNSGRCVKCCEIIDKAVPK